MKRFALAKILILSLVFLAFAPICYAQDSNTNAPNTEVLGENERLPFMQNQQNPALEEPSSGALLMKTLGAMLLIGGLIFFGAWGAKKLGFGNTNSSGLPCDLDLAILSSVSLGNGRTISTVRFGERILVVGSTPQSFTLLAEDASNEKIPAQTSRSVAEMLAEENDSFADEFERAQNKLNFREEKGEKI